jgi:transcriptional regulator with XRE-family HTH domain
MSTELIVSPIEYLRVTHRFTKRHVAAHLGMTEAAYGRMERGAFNISVENLKALSRLYEVPLDFFNSDSPVTDYQQIKKPTDPIARESTIQYGQNSSNQFSRMNSGPEKEEDIFLANLTIETLRKQLKAKDEAFEIMRQKYLDVVKQNEILKETLKNNSNG